jgi:hypothetical protein
MPLYVHAKPAEVHALSESPEYNTTPSEALHVLYVFPVDESILVKTDTPFIL